MYPFLRNDGDSFAQAQPLNPCSHGEHVKLYAPVDNTQSSYEEYQTLLDVFSGIPKGHAILTYGASGCGKSSLIYRCIELAKGNAWQRNGKQLKPYIFDFHNEKLSNYSAKEKVVQINEFMAEALEEDKITELLGKKFFEKFSTGHLN